jgi:thiazole synthase ThiGH ThiG subunit
MIDKLKVANKRFNSRLIVGTGKYKNMSECAKAIKLSGADIVTVAVRRVNISDKSKPLLMDYIDPKKNYIFTKYSWMFYLRRCFENFKTCKRNWWMEACQT